MKITTANAAFEINILGTGSKNILAFHGVGHDSKAFDIISHHHPEFTIYAIDLPFHGNTEVFKPKNAISNEEVIDLVRQIIDHFSIQQFTLLGYSIGAKLALLLIPEFASQIQNIWLLAPDGIRQNFWYQIGTKTSIGRSILYQTLLRPHILKSFGKALKSMKIVDQNTFRIVSGSTQTKEKSMQVYQVWIYMHKLIPDLDAIAKTLNKTNIPLHIFLGDEDRIITKQSIQPLAKKVSNIKTTMLHSRHQHLIKKFADCDLENFS